ELDNSMKTLRDGLDDETLRQSRPDTAPSTWEIQRIEQFADLRTGGTPSTAVKEYWNDEVPWMSSGDVNQGIIKKVSGSISRLGMENSNAKPLPKGTVVIALAGQGKTRGKVGLLEIETTCNQSVAGVLIKSK